MLNSAEQRRLTETPWYADFTVVIGLILVFYCMLKVLMAISERWKKMMQKRIQAALDLRKAQRDPFRAENGYSWDYVLVFKVMGPDDKITEKQKNPSRTLKGIVLKLAEAGLQTKLFYSVQNDEVYCKIRAPLKRLMKEADRINYRLPLEATAVANVLREGNQLGPEEKRWKGVNIPNDSPLTDLDPYDYIYTAFEMDGGERMLYKKSSNGTIFRGVDRLKLIAGIIAARTDDGGCHIDCYRLIKDGCLLAYFPLHDYVELRTLEEKWIRFFQFPWRQSTDHVKDYFGEKVGVYFLWLGHYTTCLIPAAIVGFFCWINVAADNNDPNAAVMPYFAAFIAIWATVFHELWKRKEKDAAMRWGMVGFEEVENDRPEFDGVKMPNPINGVERLYFPAHEYAARILHSSSIVSVLILVVIAVVASIFYFRVVMSASRALIVGDVQTAGIIASLLNAVQIQVMNYIYGSVSVYLNDYENHRTDTEYEDALIGKTFVFQFVNSYAALFYISFVKPFIPEYDPCLISCMSELQTSLGTIFLTRLATGNILKIVLPYIDQKSRQSKESKGAKGTHLTEVEKLYMLTPYHVTLDIFADYAEMMIQFGYTTMFIVAFPLATVMAFVNNYVEMRVEAWKLCQLCRRPEPRSCEDIGTWASIVEIMGVAAVLINAGLVAFTGSVAFNYTWPSRVWIFICMSGGILFTKFYLGIAIPDVSTEVEIQLARQDFIVSKVINNVGDDDEEIGQKNVKINVQYTIRITDDDPL